MCNLFSWHVITSSFDLFDRLQPFYNPKFTYPTLNFILNISVQTYFTFFPPYLSYRTLTLSALIGILFSLCSVPIFAIYLGEQTGFYLTAASILIVGLSNGVLYSSIITLAFSLHEKLIIFFSAGVGVSGIIANLIKISLLAINSEKEDLPTMIEETAIFFCVSAGVVIFSLFLSFIMFRNEEFCNEVSKINSSEDKSILELLKKLVAQIPISIYLNFLTFCITVMIYPGLVLESPY